MERKLEHRLCLLLILALPGCGIVGNPDATKPAPLDSAFSRSSSADVRRGPSEDRAGLISYDTARPDPTVSKRPAPPTPIDLSQNPTANGVSKTVNETVVSPGADAVARNDLATASTPAPSPLPNPPKAPATAALTKQTPTEATYWQLGAVVVEVNGTPIFANKVIDTITPLLAAKAKQLDEGRFKAVANEEIHNQVKTLVRDELEYATAERNLDSNDKRIADALTERWRDDQIRKAGGSLQLARQKAASQGIDFDELVKEDARAEMRRVYFQKKEMPKIQVTADDMRNYYAHHLNDQFTEHEQAKFRVIKISVAEQGGDADKASAAADAIHQRLTHGEDFTALAGTTNDDPYLKRTHGDVSGTGGWTDKGAYAVTSVEDAVWKLQPGQITPVIRDGAAFYIAQLEQKKGGHVRSFDNEDVQTQIRDQLQREQFGALRDAVLERLMKDAIITPDPPIYAPALEMAMQKYPGWAKK